MQWRAKVEPAGWCDYDAELGELKGGGKPAIQAGAYWLQAVRKFGRSLAGNCFARG